MVKKLKFIKKQIQEMAIGMFEKLVFRQINLQFFFEL